MPDDLLTTIRAEIDARMSELRPLLDEYEGLLSATDALGPAGSSSWRGPARRGSAAGGKARVKARSSSPRGRPPTRARAPRGAAGKAILAALEHGSHTVGELATVTAMADPNIRANIRRMLAEGTIVKISREGKAAYALPTAALHGAP
jgi:hypothetical protein